MVNNEPLQFIQTSNIETFKDFKITYMRDYRCNERKSKDSCS